MNKIAYTFAFAILAAVAGTAHSSDELNIDIELLKDGQKVYETKNLVLKPHQEFHSSSYTITNYPLNTEANSYNKVHVGYAIELKPAFKADGKIRVGATLEVVTKALADRDSSELSVSDATVEEINEPNVLLKDGEVKLLGSATSGNAADGYSLKIKATKIR